MHEFSEPHAITKDKLAADAAVGFANANESALNLLFGAQRMLFDEFVFASSEIFDRMRTEAHLFAEFASKMAEVHSVDGVRAMWQECSQHQIDFVCRGGERLLRHGQRTIESASMLISMGN